MAVRLSYQDAQIITLGLASIFSLAMGYKIYTVEDESVCNQTIWLGEGPESAAILRLTEKDFYSFDNLHCFVIFRAPLHNWSGLTGVLEEVDLRRYEDPTGHHLGQAFCVDYIMLHSGKSSSAPLQEQCGAWDLDTGQPLSKLGYRRALVGFCPRPRSSSIKCDGMSTLMVEVSVGLQKNDYLWREQPWRPHRGFTFVVTAYSYSSVSGHCHSNLWSCGGSDSGVTSAAAAATAPAGSGHHHHCIHESLWCDGHVNCGTLENRDELFCGEEELWGGLVTMVAGPWLGAVFFLLLVLGVVVYWWRTRPRGRPEGGQQGAPPEFNSCMESYELSSNVSSAHHMAIQVRVLCNAGHTRHNVRATPASATAAWQTDLPPAYDALFPRGPPESYSFATAATTTTNVSNAVVSFASSSSKTTSISSSSSFATVVSSSNAGGVVVGPTGVTGSPSVATNLEPLTGQMALSVASIQTINCGHPSGIDVPTPSAGGTTSDGSNGEVMAAASVTTTVTCSASYPASAAEESQGAVLKDTNPKGAHDDDAVASAGEAGPAPIVAIIGGTSQGAVPGTTTTTTTTIVSAPGVAHKRPPPPPPPRKDRSPNRLASSDAPPAVVEGVKGPDTLMMSTSEGGRPLTLGFLPSPSDRSPRDDTASFSTDTTTITTTTLPSASTPPASPTRGGGGGGEEVEDGEEGGALGYPKVTLTHEKTEGFL